jgi:hypothetical protein
MKAVDNDSQKNPTTIQSGSRFESNFLSITSDCALFSNKKREKKRDRNASERDSIVAQLWPFSMLYWQTFSRQTNLFKRQILIYADGNHGRKYLSSYAADRQVKLLIFNQKPIQFCQETKQ